MLQAQPASRKPSLKRSPEPFQSAPRQTLQSVHAAYFYTSVVNNLAVVAELSAVINTMQPPTASAVAAPPPGEPFNDTSAPHSPVAPPVPSHRGQDGALGYGNRQRPLRSVPRVDGASR